ncbi:MAG TPA: hypothetical protein GXX14_01655, partial [Clostridiaceae bacterium]|nr:hypothetical protein [Clostridiaceae bacterium]
SKEYFDRLFNFRPSDSGNIGRVPEAKGEIGIEPDLVPPDSPQNPDLPRNQVKTDETGYAEDLVLSKADARDNPVSDRGSGVIYDTGEQAPSVESASSAGSVGSVGNALGNPVTIKIYNRFEVYYETVYYPNIGFISRYKVTDEFADFLNRYIR